MNFDWVAEKAKVNKHDAKQENNIARQKVSSNLGVIKRNRPHNRDADRIGNKMAEPKRGEAKK